VKVLIDSDILIEVTRAKDLEILRRWSQLAGSQDAVFCSPVSVAELCHGARLREHGVLTNLFRAMKCISIDAEIGHRAGDFLRDYRKSHGLELGDALIAASVVATGAVLWTQNRKHYPVRAVSCL
jgi:predicted nucleic acid-binding protein